TGRAGGPCGTCARRWRTCTTPWGTSRSNFVTNAVGRPGANPAPGRPCIGLRPPPSTPRFPPPTFTLAVVRDSFHLGDGWQVTLTTTGFPQTGPPARTIRFL